MKKLNVIICFLVLIILICSIYLNIHFLKRNNKITKKDIASAEKLIGMEFTTDERELMLEKVSNDRSAYENMRKIKLANSDLPAIRFSPDIKERENLSKKNKVSITKISSYKVPNELSDLAYAAIPELAHLIKTRQITSVQLTKMFIRRLEKYGDSLKCVITLAKDHAFKQAQKADEEIAAGNYRGLLHGIPWGAKDLLAIKGIKTTWGAYPFRDQIIDYDATVVKKLEQAGAVLVAKLSLGALAMGDVWYGGKTRNPWDTSQGSSGSSAGPAAAVSAGLLPFTIGSETWGSIVSPSTICGVTGLRPTFGRVSRTGAMVLSWTMDKLGPICRNAEDCAIVFNAIHGPDGEDPTVKEVSFTFDPKINFRDLTIGYVKKDFESDYNFRESDSLTLVKLRQLGANLVPIDLPDFNVENISFLLVAEAAAAFDEFTRSGKSKLLTRQGKGDWADLFRSSRFIPAVDYINANRVRLLIMKKIDEIIKEIDLYVAPSRHGNNLLLTNLTGHPCVVVPNGFSDDGTPRSFSFTGKLYDESTILAVANAYQKATDFHLKHPKF